jgi:GNAT superfamily N-acetyltransferase
VNLEAQAEYLAYLRRAGATRQVDGAFAVKTGAFSNTENGVVASGSVADVGSLVAWFSDAPASWLDLGGLNHDALLAAGASPENNGHEMGMRIDDLRLTPPEDVAVEPADVGEWFDFASAHNWFGDPAERVAFERLYRDLVGERFRLTVARADGVVAGFASAFYGRTSVLLTQVIVDDGFRRRGVATALVAERIERARELGCERATLGPSPEGARLYTALGFELLDAPPNRWYYLPLGSARADTS